MTRPVKIFFTLSLVSFVLGACSNLKYLPKGQKLYTGGKVKVDDKEVSKSEAKTLSEELTGLLRPKPNTAILGLRPKLYAYNIAGQPKKKKGLKNYLKTKLGEPPVLFSSVNIDRNSQVLQNRLQNRGYFRAFITADSVINGQKTSMIYNAETGPQFKIKSIVFAKNDTTTLGKAVAATSGNSLLKVGEGYDLDVIKAERERIDARLKEKGFYFFGPDYLVMQVDSTVGTREVDILVKVKNETPEKAGKVYTINNIYIYPNYNLDEKDSTKRDTTYYKYRDFLINDPDKFIRPMVFTRSMFFHPGDVYNRRDHNLALNRLTNLGPFKFVKNSFREVDSAGTPKLDTYYYLSPYQQKSVRLELLGRTNSANFTGSEINLSWRHKNAFKGAELLTLSLFGGADVQASGRNSGYNIYRMGANASIVWPRLIIPFNINPTNAFVPRTQLSVGYEFVNRSKLYSLNNYRGSFGYIFKENIRKEHQLNLLNVSYVNSANITQEYRDSIDNDKTNTLARVVEDQLIIGPSYNFNYTNTMEENRRNTFYYNGSIKLSNNIYGLVTGADTLGDNTKSIFGVRFNQFIKMEHDFRHYFKITENNVIASRVILGYGYAYGNSAQMPFTEQFFTGGPNSIRAFRARSIGPGTYRAENIDDRSFLPDQSGDIKFEMNTELRFKLVSVLRGALFLDAGNVWNLRDDPNKPGTQFSSAFLRQLAVGTGVGLRADISVLVIRGDVGFPLRKPWLPEGERWKLDTRDPVFNLAIGYPF
ncbi:MAG: BamA/TamA family outer membrane protein [Mucilaginibacter polytrichastri]|nr:BamA/TamA family outer membrane protein [Mucilaginibacter polytrichastri]